RIRVARSKRQKHLGQSPVWPYGGEYLFVFNLPCHDRGAHAFTLEKFNELAQFAQRHPVHYRGAATLNERGSLFLDGGHHHLSALGAGRLQQQQGKAPIACTQSEFLSFIHSVQCTNCLHGSCFFSSKRTLSFTPSSEPELNM